MSICLYINCCKHLDINSLTISLSATLHLLSFYFASTFHLLCIYPLSTFVCQASALRLLYSNPLSTLLLCSTCSFSDKIASFNYLRMNLAQLFPPSSC